MSIKVADAFVLVGADMSKYREELKGGEKDAQSLGQQIRQAFTNPAGFGGGSKVAGLIADLKLGRSITASLQDAAKGLGGTLKSLSVNALHSGLNGIKNVLGGLKGLASDVFKGFSIGLGIGSFQALGRALSDLINIIPDLIAKGRDYGRTVDDIADATGATTKQASEFTGTLLFLGQTTGHVLNMIGQMSRNLDEQEPILNKLGVTTRDVSGAQLNQIQILENARHVFHQLGVGTAQADQIAREFGRGGLRTLVDYLHLTDEQAKKVSDDLQKQGLILTDYQRDLGESMIREEARFQNALVGLGETIFTVVGPQLRAFFSNLSDTITANVTEISTAISNAVSFILGLVTALVGAENTLNSFSGAIQAANVVNSPYSAHLLQLRVELGKLEEQTDKTTDTTADQRRGINASIGTVRDQIAAIQALEKQQEKTYKRALDLIYQQLDAQGKLLDLEEQAGDRADRDLALTRQLRDAKIGLFEAQAQLRQDEIDNLAITDPAKRKSTEQDILDIAKAQEAVLDAQKAIRDEGSQRGRDARRAELAGVRDYAESVAKILEDADDKRAALRTIKNRQRVLEERKASQLASGDTTGAGDTELKLEVLRTTEKRAQEQIRNGIEQTALEARREQLESELAAVQSTTREEARLYKKNLEERITDLETLEANWTRSNVVIRDSGRKAYRGIGAAIRGGEGEGTGLMGAMNDARLAGITFAKDVKTAIGGLVDVLSDMLQWLVDIKDMLDSIADSDVWKILNTKPLADAPRGPQSVADPTFGNKGARSELGNILREIWDRYIGNPLSGNPFGNRVDGGWIGARGPGLFWGGEGGREYVLDNTLSEKLNRFFSMPQVPAFAPAAATGGGSGGGHGHDIYMDGRKVGELLDRGLGFRSGR